MPFLYPLLEFFYEWVNWLEECLFIPKKTKKTENTQDCRINTAFCLLHHILTKLPALICVIIPQENNRTLKKISK